MYHVINEMENNISTVMKNKLNPDQNIESLENDTDTEDVVEEYVAGVLQFIQIRLFRWSSS